MAPGEGVLGRTPGSLLVEYVIQYVHGVGKIVCHLSVSLRVRQLHLDEGLFGGGALCRLGLLLDGPGFLSRERDRTACKA